MRDQKLMLKEYEVVEFEMLEGCWFYCEIGIFDNQMNDQGEIKMKSKGGKGREGKVFVNNVYGKVGSSWNSSFKVGYVKEDESIGFQIVGGNNKKVGDIGSGSGIR